MKNNSLQSNQQHPFHLVNPSPWPFFASFGALGLTIGLTLSMHNYSGGSLVLSLGLGAVLFAMYVWWRDIVREGTFEGQHTVVVQQGLRMGMLLFIVSEVMFFFAFFWAFFHSSLVPVIAVGGIWPPMGIEALDPWELPLLNTVLLLTSGATLTYAHHEIVGGHKDGAILGLVATVALGFIFTCCQAVEYLEAPFSISDGIYGSVFYLATGFHGFHVLIGTIFLVVTLLRLGRDHFSRQHHFGFEAAAWYWHFVDVVWLFLFVTIYWWGS